MPYILSIALDTIDLAILPFNLWSCYFSAREGILKIELEDALR